jgi:hypothetical protein
MRSFRVSRLLVGVALGACGTRVSSNNPAGGDGGTDPVAGTACTSAGQTEPCCGDGTRTCEGDGEFSTWGPCVSQSGSAITCPGCGAGEFGGCDAGILPPPPMLCHEGGVNNEPEILVGYEPDNGHSVGSNGQIKVWVNDEHPEIIATNEQIDPTTGVITAPGDRTALAPDHYLWEPAVYIAPQSAENGGTPHFPTVIKGDYNNHLAAPPSSHVPGMDPVPPGHTPHEAYTTEIIWDVNSLGLLPGVYVAEFMIHDGDFDRGVGCVTIEIIGGL